MAMKTRILHRYGIAIGVLLLAVSVANATNITSPNKLRKEAEALERKGEWQQAGEIYLRLLAQDKNSPDLRGKILICLRHIQQKRRHTDPQYLERIRELPLSRALNAYLDGLGKLQANYVDREKIDLAALFQRGLEELKFALDEPAFRKEHFKDSDADAIQSLKQQLIDVWSVAKLRQASEIREAVKEIALTAQQKLGVQPSITVMEFLCGACNTLDEHTAYLPPSEETAIYAGQLTALGVMLSTSADGQVQVVRVLPGTWAAQAEIRDGDRVAKFVGKNCENGELEQLIEIEVVGQGGMNRRTIKMPALLNSVFDVETSPDGVGYLRIAGFTRTTPQELHNAFHQLRMRGTKSLIVDLRGNPGGLFPVAVDVAEQFLPEGIIVTTQGQGAIFNRTFESRSGMGAFNLPLVVLVDGDTASAAEVLAGALKENNRATLIGQPTYGKGTIQNVLQLSAGGGMRITLARFFTPRGTPYQAVGVTPDLIESVRPRELAHEQALKSMMMRND